MNHIEESWRLSPYMQKTDSRRLCGAEELVVPVVAIGLEEAV